MGFGDSVLVKPGTVFLFVLILVVGAGMLHWTSSTVQDSGQDARDSQSTTIECGGLKIDLVDLQVSNSTVNAYFIVNNDVDSVRAVFEGDNRIERGIDYNGSGSLGNISVNLEGFKQVSLTAPPCKHRFIYAGEQ